jgi:hypothetical protein
MIKQAPRPLLEWANLLRLINPEKQMNNKKIFYNCIPVLLTIATGLSDAVNVEGFILDSANKAQTTQTVQSEANSIALQGNLTNTLINKLQSMLCGGL